MAAKLISWEQLYAGLEILSGYQAKQTSVADVDLEIARSLPRLLMVESRLQPIRIDGKVIVIATSEIPSENLLAEIRKFTASELHLILVTPSNLQELRDYAEKTSAFVVAA